MGMLDPEYTGKVRKKSKSILPDKMDADGGGMFGMDNLKSAGTAIGTELAAGIGEKVGGKGMSNAIKAGMSSGFNPYVMAGAAILGVASAAAERKRKRRMGEARADMERAEGEQKKSDIYGQMAKSIRGSLGGAQRKRSVNL